MNEKEDLILQNIQEIKQNQKEFFILLRDFTKQTTRIEGVLGMSSDNGLRGRIGKIEDKIKEIETNDIKPLNQFKYYATAFWILGKIFLFSLVGVFIKKLF